MILVQKTTHGAFTSGRIPCWPANGSQQSQRERIRRERDGEHLLSDLRRTNCAALLLEQRESQAPPTGNPFSLSILRTQFALDNASFGTWRYNP
ncbi:Hypothetical protein NTJ_09244 [Nesidiocoris tenuis]|uniref:Uncharacterized protein n=1 Tax=Nesidiocoris tenuis TaxID=355587 RepID=A0ABN7AW86_9HEMI|nr:Hypothetical protein NTJ_09244 [Nesidiocoris tenuis]